MVGPSLARMFQDPNGAYTTDQWIAAIATAVKVVYAKKVLPEYFNKIIDIQSDLVAAIRSMDITVTDHLARQKKPVKPGTMIKPPGIEGLVAQFKRKRMELAKELWLVLECRSSGDTLS